MHTPQRFTDWGAHAFPPGLAAASWQPPPGRLEPGLESTCPSLKLAYVAVRLPQPTLPGGDGADFAQPVCVHKLMDSECPVPTGGPGLGMALAPPGGPRARSWEVGYRSKG